MDISQPETVCDYAGRTNEPQLLVSLEMAKARISGQLQDHCQTNNDLAHPLIRSHQVHHRSVQVQTNHLVTHDQGSQTEPQELQLCVRCRNITDENACVIQQVSLEKRDIQWDKTTVEWKKGSPGPRYIIKDASITVDGNHVFIGTSSRGGSLRVYDSTKDEWLPYEIECPCPDFQATVVRNTLVLVPNDAAGGTTIHTFDLTGNRSWDNTYPPIPVCVCTPKVTSTASYLIVTFSAGFFDFMRGLCILDVDSNKWHVCDYRHLPSWINGPNAIATDGEIVYIASESGSMASCSLPELVNFLNTKGPVKPLFDWNRLPSNSALDGTGPTDMTTLYGYLVVVVAKTLLIFDPKNHSWKRSIIPVSYDSSGITAISTLPDGKLIAFSEGCPFIGTLEFDGSWFLCWLIPPLNLCCIMYTCTKLLRMYVTSSPCRCVLEMRKHPYSIRSPLSGVCNSVVLYRAAAATVRSK